ncbi:MAG: response regulator [Flavobacterium sp.]|nr:MAG: response regulator [Flavobacterium sp.]
MEQQLSLILADDDPDDRELFVELLARPDVSVKAVTNGKELLSYLKTLPSVPDCIFLDLNMPVMAGKDCLTKIRASEKLKNVPVVIYSTSANKKDIEETFALGANLYLVKESSYSALKRTFEKILQLDWANYPPHRQAKNFVFKL